MTIDEAKLAELQIIHRDLARFISEQHEAILAYSLVIGALRKTIEEDSSLSGKYKANLKSLKDAEPHQPNPLQAGVLHGFLRRLREW